MKQWFNTAELAEALHCSVKQIRRLRKYGLIEGIRTSKGYVYHEYEVDQFWQTFRGCDLSNEDKIRLAYAQKKGDSAKTSTKRRSR